MKLHNDAAPVQVVGGGVAGNFSIAANGKAFRVLSDTLYADKIGSIVRELSCNAYDAHVACGKQSQPFEIHFPDEFEPWFSVKDYGIGLSPDDITNVFTVYFQSTKDNSNDSIGAFGLGAKTPFSYTDQFTVTSIKDGVMSIYSAFIAQNGMPCITKMHDEPHVGCNGVEIKMSVKREDYRKFSEAISNQLRFFKVKPELFNQPNGFEFQSGISNASYESEKIRVGKNNSYSAKQYLIQGQVGYPINFDKLTIALGYNTKVVKFLENIRYTDVELYFDIGQIGVTASREGIEYDNTTVSNICKLVESVIPEIESHLSDVLSNLTNYQKAEYLNSNSSLMLNIAKVTNYQIDGFRMQGNSYSFSLRDSFYDSANKRAIAGIYVRNTGKIKFTTHQVHTIAPTESVKIMYVVKDESKSYSKRIEAKATEIKANMVVMVDPWLAYTNADECYKILQKTLSGCNTVFKVSQLEKVKSQPRSVVRNPVAQYHVVTGTDWMKDKIKIEGKENNVASIKEKSVYIVMDSKSAMEGVFREYFNMKNNYSAFVDFPQMVVIYARQESQAKNNPNMTYAYDYLNKVRSLLQDNDSLKINEKRTKLRQLIQNHMFYLVNEGQLAKSIKDKATDTKIAKLLKIYNKIKNIKSYPSVCNTKGCYNLDIAKFVDQHKLLIELSRSIVMSKDACDEIAEFLSWKAAKVA